MIDAIIVPHVLRKGALSCQVCVPHDWTDEQIVALAEREYPCGTTAGWQVRRPGTNSRFPNDPERVQCNQCPAHCHVVLDA